MEDTETARMRKYGESKTTRIMMATVPHFTSGLGLRKFQADGFLLTRVYKESVSLGVNDNDDHDSSDESRGFHDQQKLQGTLPFY